MHWLCLLLLFLGAPFQGHSEENLPCYDTQALVSIKGKVVSVQKYHFVNRPAPQAQFILRTLEGDFTVEAGPQWYLDTRGMNILPGGELEVKGSLVIIGDRKILLACTLKNDGYTLRVRTEEGEPLH